MNTKLMKYAVELSNLGSSQKVANKFGVSRSAISRNIKRLEKELGTPLFIKLQDGIVPTRSGETFLRYARQILNMEDDLRYNISSDGTYQGTVNIGMGTNRTLMILADVMPEFSNEYPRISVRVHEMRTADIMEALLARQLDFAVVSKTMHTEGITFEPLLEEDLVMVTPENNEFARSHSFQRDGRRYVRLSDFKDVPFILGHTGQQSRSIAENIFKYEGFTPKVILRTENCYAMAKMAEKGSAFALIPHSYTRLNGVKLEHYHIDCEVRTTWSVGITYVNKLELSRAAMQLKGFILRKLKDPKSKSD